MAIPALIGAGASLLGGLLSGRSAKKAAQTQADAQMEAARLAAEEARFRPVGITTRFGQSQFQTGPDGRVTGAGYTLSPELAAMQDRFMGLAGGGLDQAAMAQQQFAPLGQAAQGLFSAGQQYISQPGDQRIGGLAGGYLAESPQQVAQRFMAQQQELLAPSRERQMAQLQQGLFNTGRQGLAVGATGMRPSGAAGLSAASPEVEAYYNALAQQDLGLAAQAEEAGQRQVAFGADLLGRQLGMDQDRLRLGAGLFGTGGNLLTQSFRGQTEALGPYEAYLQQMQNLEGLGQQSLDIGSALGGRIASPSGAQALLTTGPSRESYAADAYNPFADFLTSSSRNPVLTDALRRSTAPPQRGFNYDPSGGAYGYTYQDQSAVGPFRP